MRRSPMRLGRPALGWMTTGSSPASGSICSRMSYRVLEPTEQLAPTAWMGNSRSARTTAAGARPKNVTPSSVNATWATIGRSVSARMASTACCISTGSEKVSTMKASTPPSSSPSACSKKAARASSGSTEPSGARYRPSGPMEPSTKTSRPMLSRTSRARRAPLRLISRTRPADPCIPSLKRFAPKVFVSMQSAPAWMYSVWMLWTIFGSVSFSTSKQVSRGTPRA